MSSEYAKVNDEFSKAANAYESLADILKAKKDNPAAIDAIEKRIANMLQKGTADRRLVEKVDKIAAGATDQMNAVLDAITAREFDPLVNPKFVPAAMGPAAGTAAVTAAKLLGGTGAAGATGGVLAATSPKIVGAGIRAFNAPILRKVPILNSPVVTGALPGTAIQSLLAASRARDKSQPSLSGKLGPSAERLLKSREQR